MSDTESRTVVRANDGTLLCGERFANALPVWCTRPPDHTGPHEHTYAEAARVAEIGHTMVSIEEARGNGYVVHDTTQRPVLDLYAILTAMAAHSDAHPDHGIGCACKDEHLREVRRFLSALSPRLQHEWRRVLGPAMARWEPTSLPGLEAYNAEHERRNEATAKAVRERSRRQSRKEARFLRARKG